jgi:lysozyme
MTVQDLIAGHEGFRDSPYQDQFGNLTVAYGHKLAGSPLPDTYPITQERGLQILEADIATTICLINAKPIQCFAALDEVRQAVLVDMGFQLGVNGLATFTTFLGYMAMGEWWGAAADLLTTKLASETPNRVKQNANLIMSGQWPP